MKHFHQADQNIIGEQIKLQVEFLENSKGQPGIWDFQLANGKLHRGQAWLEGYFLTLDLYLTEGDLNSRGIGPGMCWETLLQQNRPGSSAKFVPHWDCEGGGFRQEVLLGREQDWADQIAEAFSSLAETLEQTPAEDFPVAADAFGQEQLATIGTALSETDRLYTIDAQNRVSTQLTTSREKSFRHLYRYTAWIDPSDTRGIQVWVPILEGVSLDPDQSEAIGAILLEAGRRLRLVRGFVHLENGLASVALEVSRGWPVSAKELDGMLTSLTVACNQVAPEIAALGKGRVAARHEESFGFARQVYPQQTKEVLKAARQGN